MYRYLVIALSVLLLASCGSMRKSAIKISEEELKNAETAKQVAKNYLQIWPTQSGFIRAALGVRIKILPQEAMDAIDSLDELAEKQDAYTDRELGESLGYRVRALLEVTRQALELYAPDVFRALVEVGL